MSGLRSVAPCPSIQRRPAETQLSDCPAVLFWQHVPHGDVNLRRMEQKSADVDLRIDTRPTEKRFVILPKYLQILSSGKRSSSAGSGHLIFRLHVGLYPE